MYFIRSNLPHYFHILGLVYKKKKSSSIWLNLPKIPYIDRSIINKYSNGLNLIK